MSGLFVLTALDDDSCIEVAALKGSSGDANDADFGKDVTIGPDRQEGVDRRERTAPLLPRRDIQVR
jgi:hypothetical protein